MVQREHGFVDVGMRINGTTKTQVPPHEVTQMSSFAPLNPFDFVLNPKLNLKRKVIGH